MLWIASKSGSNEFMARLFRHGQEDDVIVVNVGCLHAMLQWAEVTLKITINPLVTWSSLHTRIPTVVDVHYYPIDTLIWSFSKSTVPEKTSSHLLLLLLLQGVCLRWTGNLAEGIFSNSVQRWEWGLKSLRKGFDKGDDKLYRMVESAQA